MATSDKVGMSHRSSRILLIFLSLAVLSLFISSFVSPLHTIARNALADQPPHCPIILYNKQFKTGSTVVSNILFRTSESLGCRNADCKKHVMLMSGNASHVGTVGGLTMACHAKEYNHKLIASLRATHGNNFIYLASVRDPMSWFQSAACFFYKIREAGPENTWTEAGFKAAIDWALNPAIYSSLEQMLFRTLGMPPTASDQEIIDKLLMYDLVIDQAKMDEGLEELAALTKWKLLPCTDSKRTSYRGPLYNSYRKEEIRKITQRVGNLYKLAVEMRERRRERPLFAPEESGVV